MANLRRDASVSLVRFCSLTDFAFQLRVAAYRYVEDFNAGIVNALQWLPRPAGTMVSVTHFDLRVSPVNQFWWQRFPQAVERDSLPQQLTLVKWALVVFIPWWRQKVCTLHPARFDVVR